jgi:hypothetical protein
MAKNKIKFKIQYSWEWRLTPVFLATWRIEIRKIVVQG